MKPDRVLRQARRRAGLALRALAERTGLPQSTIRRIEAGLVDPRVSTLDRLLRACGDELDAIPHRGVGVDRTMFPDLLALAPRERLDVASAEARNLAAFEAAVRRPA